MATALNNQIKRLIADTPASAKRCRSIAHADLMLM